MNFCNADSADSQITGHKLLVYNSDNNGWCTRYCVRIPDGEHMINTVVVWAADHCFGFFQNKFGKCNALMNFAKEHFKCIENNDEVYNAILQYYDVNKYQRVYGAAATRFWGLHDCIYNMYHLRLEFNQRRSGDEQSESDKNSDCTFDGAKNIERERYDEIFRYCVKENSTLRHIPNDQLVQGKSSKNNDQNNTTDHDSVSDHESDDEVLEDSDNNSSKPSITISIANLVTRDTKKHKNGQTDFKKFVLYPSVLIDHVRKKHITKKTYFDTIAFWKNRLNHCAMITFRCSINYALMDLNILFFKI